MDVLEHYKEMFLSYLNKVPQEKTPESLYQPIHYLLQLEGKRLRPVLTLLAADCFEADLKTALPAAFAIEVFHNFTLMHDDIMDHAPLRRGKPTVHTRWDTNTAILSGDAMLIQAYQCLNAYDDVLFARLTKCLSQTALEVCEGQRYDIDFEKRSDVSKGDYLQMIELKTAVLSGCALQMGAMIAKASSRDIEHIKAFGVALGMAFQIQDDYLDTFGNPDAFGKQVGGDILENKKTILFHETFLLGTSQHKSQLMEWFSDAAENSQEKIRAVSQIFESSGAKEATLQSVKDYSRFAFEALDNISINDAKKNLLQSLTESLILRKH